MATLNIRLTHEKVCSLKIGHFKVVLQVSNHAENCLMGAKKMTDGGHFPIRHLSDGGQMCFAETVYRYNISWVIGLGLGF